MTKNLRRIQPTESQIQMAIIQWANITKVPINSEYYRMRNMYIGEFLVKFANEGKRSYMLGKKMKKEGLKSGFPDLCLFLPTFKQSINTDYLYISECALLIEVKSKLGKLSKKQINTIDFFKNMPYPIKVVRSVDEGIQAIKDYLGMR